MHVLLDLLEHREFRAQYRGAIRDAPEQQTGHVLLQDVGQRKRVESQQGESVLVQHAVQHNVDVRKVRAPNEYLDALADHLAQIDWIEVCIKLVDEHLVEMDDFHQRLHLQLLGILAVDKQYWEGDDGEEELEAHDDDPQVALAQVKPIESVRIDLDDGRGDCDDIADNDDPRVDGE